MNFTELLLLCGFNFKQMKKTNLLFLALALLFATYSCQPKSETKPERCNVNHPEWVSDAVIYEVNVRQYTKEGTFAAFGNYLPQLKELGVNTLWFMPIHPISELNRKGTLGSYYAIADYKGINPEFGTHDDFRQLVEKAHEMGFKVIIDWVANHTGWDNVWIAEHPEWYAVDSLGNLIAPYDWTDVAKLNYDNNDMRAAMLDAMKYWVSDFNIDGFRCDVAYEVPTDFWENARVELDKIKPVFMLAESEKPELLDFAFDADYGWELMHLMNSIAKGEKNANDIYNYLLKTDTITCPDALKMNFITNHDENSWSGTEYERYGAGVETFAVLTYTLNGIPLIYSGQEVGLQKRLEFFEKDPILSWEKNDTFTFYQQLNQLKNGYSSLHTGIKGGKVERINTSDNERLFFFKRSTGNEEIVVLLNLSGETVDFAADIDLSEGAYTNYFEKNEGIMPIQMKPWEYKVLVKREK